MFDHIEAFYQPTDIREAVRLLHRLGPGSRLLAGGTDLTVQADRSTRFLVDITRLGLNYIHHKPGFWAIGATTTMSALEDSAGIRKLADGILAHAASTCGSMQLRNMATIGGNLANASPAADTATPLLALDASVVVEGRNGRRTLPLENFFTGPRRTMLNGALLVEIQFADCKPHTGWSFQKLCRTEADISLVNVAAGLGFGKSGVCNLAHLALGAVAPTPIRARAAEALLVGQKLTPALLDRVAKMISREARPITDLRASEEYRRAMAGVLARHALLDCAEHAGYGL